MNMTTNTDKLIENDVELASAVKRASKILDGVAGNTVLRVAADWKAGGNSTREPMVALTLTEQGGATLSALFTRDEMQRPERLQRRLHRLWGDLLQVASHKQMEKVKQLVAQLEEV